MSDIWKSLSANHAENADRPIVSLFQDPDRFRNFSTRTDGMLLDYSKTNLDSKAVSLLLELARDSGVEEKRDAMFRGEKINRTEGRAVLHTALRTAGEQEIQVDGKDVVKSILATRQTMLDFAEGVRSGEIASADGQPFTDIVNIGIGGSDLGPAMAVEALRPYHDGPRCHFVSNVDGADIHDRLQGLDPRRTLVIVVSKSFTTTETMANAKFARNWLQGKIGKDVKRHLVAVSSAVPKAKDFGVDPERVFGFGDYVGGRYSVWGPVGLALMLAIGPQAFSRFLQGGHAMDRHFVTAPLAENMPVLLGLVGVWHNNICGHSSRAVLPYDQRLARLPDFLQQLDMESNGKSVTLAGQPTEQNTGPVVWGAAGTNGQHAFYQLLHQGTTIVPCEFLIAAVGHEPELADHHALLKANCLAQSKALMIGRPAAHSGGPKNRAEPYRQFPGNRPSVTLAYQRLTPFVLGQILALYEHRVFVEGAIWGINSFDQWGVELGKALAEALVPMVSGVAAAENEDGSTLGLLEHLAPSGDRSKS